MSPTALRRRGITSFAVVEPDAAWVLRLLAGAALAGAEPCQYQPDTDATEFADQRVDARPQVRRHPP